MEKGRILTVIGAALAALCTPYAAQAERQETNAFAMQILEEHNQARDDVDVPRLEWSQELAQQAQEWAVHLAGERRMYHSTREQRNDTGENLWAGSAGYYGADAMIAAFVDERQYYRHETFPNVSTTGRWSDVGHYTQIVWRETREVGCAVARNDEFDFLVCRYWPSGNIIGQPVY